MRYFVALAALFALMYIAPLGMRPLIIPDETRYAEIPREMLARGDMVVPRLCGVRYFEKPPMGYWLTAASISLFGENRFAVRFPSAAATAVSALLIATLVRAATGAANPALWAAFIFITMPFVFALGVTNVLDAPFAAAVTATLVFAFRGVGEQQARRRFAWLAAAGAAAGAAFLIKGFLAFVLPALVVVPYLAIQRRWREMLTLPWVPLAVAAIVVFPWAMAIHAREPDYWRYFVMEEHIQRFLDPKKGQHPEPFWFLVPHLVAGPLAWTFLAPAIGRRFGAEWAERRPLVLFCICWLAAPFLFFSASSGKLPTYILPCFAPVAVLLGLGAARLPDQTGNRLRRAGCAVSAVVAGAALTALAAGPFLPSRLRIYGPGEGAAAAVIAIALAAWLAVSLVAAFAAGDRRGALLAGIAPAPMMVALHFALPARSIDGRAPERVLDESSPLVTSGTMFFTDSYMAPAICWQYKTEKVFITGSGELAYGLSYPEHRHHAVTQEGVAATLANPDRKRDAAAVFPIERAARISPPLPMPDEARTANGVAFYLYRTPGKARE